MNRLAQYFEEAEEPGAEDSYWIVETRQYWFIVDAETARWIERQLDRWWAPRWLVFTDAWQVRRRILLHSVDHISESTPAMRAAARAFRRARDLEEQTDRRPWQDGDFT